MTVILLDKGNYNYLFVLGIQFFVTLKVMLLLEGFRLKNYVLYYPGCSQFLEGSLVNLGILPQV